MKFLSLILFWSVLLVDLGLKRFIYLHLSIQDSFSIFKDFLGISFHLCHVTNRGAAWGIWEEWPLALNLVRVALIMGLVFYIGYSIGWISTNTSIPKTTSSCRRIPLVLIAAGGIGNLIDYFLYGHVIDMFHITFWGYSYPVFNVADATICLGVICFLYQAFKPTKQVPVENIPHL